MYLPTTPVGWRVVRAVFVSAALLAVSAEVVARQEPEPLRQRISRLIEQLGDEDYFVRQRAQEELAKIGFAAFDALGAAVDHEDLEIASRAKYLLRLIRMQWTQEDDPPQVKTLLRDYEFQPPDVRLERIQQLARLPAGKGIPALCRVIRFEKSGLLSKYAAKEVLDREPLDQAGRSPWAAQLKEYLASSSRPAARWLLAYLKLGDDPKAALPAWAELVEAEGAILGQKPAESSPQIVSTLLYRLAEAQAAQANQQLADQTAARARQLISSKNTAELLAHIGSAYVLRRRGLFKWAELQYRRVADVSDPVLKAVAQVFLSEMWHDQANNLAAAESLQDVLSLDARTLTVVSGFFGQSVGEIRARMKYFFACHWAEKGDHQKQQGCLDEALEADPTEIDALIARHRLPDPTAEYHQKTLKLIAAAASELHRMIGEFPQEATYCNQFAWLIGNTEGDFDEALRFARKAIEMEPDNGAFYDTLAHVYYGKGDYQNAVKYQTRAAELEPHSGLIIRQLKFFHHKLEENKKPKEKAASPTQNQQLPSESGNRKQNNI